MKKLIVLGLIFGLMCLAVPKALAHQNGCHRWHSCPSDSGSYVCGDLGYYTYCPSSVPQTPAPAPLSPPPPTPKQPVVITKTEATDETIKYGSKNQSTENEYEGFSKVITTGVNGLRRKTIEVTLTDGKETSRKTVGETIVQAAHDQITLVGKRKKPSALITKVTPFGKGKFSVAGKFRPNSEVVLGVGSKKVKRLKTDKKGAFTFKNISINGKVNQLAIFDSKPAGLFRRSEHLVSETTEVQLDKKILITEYQKIHKDRLKQLRD